LNSLEVSVSEQAHICKNRGLQTSCYSNKIWNFFAFSFIHVFVVVVEQELSAVAPAVFFIGRWYYEKNILSL